MLHFECVCMCILLSINGYLGKFHFLEIVNNTSVYMELQTSLPSTDLISFTHMLFINIHIYVSFQLLKWHPWEN